tara:strand:- start:251 stop:2026 length:1776 start_codon:yes stop_codon:yes gene_type:complete
MKYPKEYLDEIKTRLKVSNVVSKTVNLKKRGKEFIGLSPFKNEKTPSFTINDEKGFYHCFSTGEHGNIFDFIMKTQNLKFGEAVKTLANLAGMRPYTFSKIDEEREKSWQEYSSLFSKYIDHYHNNLIKNKNLNFVREYLKNRNISLGEIEKFQIGFVENNSNFLESIIKIYSKKKILETGLFYFDENKKKFIEKFKNRIIFPINNITAKPIALGGRIIQESSFQAKYINSPETPHFRKGSILYNLDKARILSSSVENIFLVEGYMDVIGLNRNGIENVVANLGTSLTDKQIKILNQFFDNIIICFDGDESGYKAALRAAENSIIELKPDKNISFLFLENNDDPDSFVNKKGKEFFLEFAKKNTIPIHKFLFNHYKNQSKKDPSSLAIFEKKLRSISNSIKDEFIKKYILEYFLDKISELTPNINNKFRNFKPKKIKSLEYTKKIISKTESLTSIELKEYSLLFLVINYLDLFQENFYIIEDVKLLTKENKIIFDSLVNKLKENTKFSLEDMSLDNQIIEKILKFAPIKNILLKKDENSSRILELFDEIKRDLKNHELELRIEELESKFSKDLSETTFDEIRKLKKLQKIN